MCELWVHFLETSRYTPYFNLDPNFEENYSFAVWTVSSFLWELHGTFPYFNFVLHFEENSGVLLHVSEWVHWELHETWAILTVTGLNFELTIKGGEPLSMLWAACLKKSLTFVWRILPPYSLEKASFLFQETSHLCIGQASSLIQGSSLVHIHWKKVHLCLTKCHPTWHQQTQKMYLWMKVQWWFMGFVSMGYQNCRPSFHHMFKHRWKLNTNFQ